jgi:hypothetical protein
MILAEISTVKPVDGSRTLAILSKNTELTSNLWEAVTQGKTR